MDLVIDKNVKELKKIQEIRDPTDEQKRKAENLAEEIKEVEQNMTRANESLRPLR